MTTTSHAPPNASTRSSSHAGIIGKGSRVPTSAGPGPDLMTSATLEGNTVLSSDGHDVGTIKEIMLDVRSGRVAYAVLSSGGFLGVGDELRAIPWSALTLDTDRKCFLIGVRAERVKAAPSFDKQHWPLMADASWSAGVHQYYETEPYWTIGASGDTGPGAPL
ncbi:PRC-barrel domain-containing protein [Pararobbsia alpina]|uniref:PRC-barrel domain-containing protein n=1 Tax=Pararobbsia alpina TaxID=621374 RepID=UPI0039A4E5DC